MKLAEWLQAKQGQVFRYKMEKIEYALSLIGNPERAVPVIHVAGTNGKGSTIAFMNELFQRHKLTVGTFVSPHMISVHDRICINGTPIADEDFQGLLRSVYNLETKVADRYEPFRYFEVMVLIVFLYFQDKNPDLALIEVGIGGLLDTTNVVDPLIAVITSIGMDHQDLLGDSLVQIAQQKAGIIKPSRPLVLGPLPPEAVAVCQQLAQEKAAPVYLAGREYQYGYGWFENEQGRWTDLELGLEGPHQLENASLALQTFLLYMKEQGLAVDQETIREALRSTSWPGRLERVWDQPAIYLDGAHNVPAIQRLVEFVKAQEGPVTILFSALLRKDFQEMLALLAEELPQVSLVLTSFSYDGALREEAAWGTYESDYQTFIENWKQEGEGMLLITGSLYFISEVRPLFV